MNSLRAFLSLSVRLRAYLIAWYVLGAFTIVYVAWRLPAHWWLHVLPYVALSLLLNLKTVVRGTSGSAEGSASASISSSAAFAAIVGVFPLAGVPVESFSTLIDSLFPKRRPLFQALFNISVCSTGALAAGLVYGGLTRLATPDGQTVQLPFAGPGLPAGQTAAMTAAAMATAAGPMLAACLIYFLVNTTAVAQAVGLASGADPSEVWKRSFKTTFVGYIAGGACAVLVLGLSAMTHHWLPFLFLTGPILYAAYSREQSDEARVQALEKGRDRLQRLYMASIHTLALTVDARDAYTSKHIYRVTSYAKAIAGSFGLSDDELTELETGALLHDIGKIGVPEYILTKPGKLTPEEMNQMRRHAEIGHAIIEPLDFPETVKHIVRHHHEWYNGTGYPDGLAGEEIPLMVRILSVADVFDALTSDRPYRGALPVDEAREIMRRNSGSQFDPLILTVFFEVLNTVPMESLQPDPARAPVLTKVLDNRPGQRIDRPARDAEDLPPLPSLFK